MVPSLFSLAVYCGTRFVKDRHAKTEPEIIEKSTIFCLTNKKEFITLEKNRKDGGFL